MSRPAAHNRPPAEIERNSRFRVRGSRTISGVNTSGPSSRTRGRDVVLAIVIVGVVAAIFRIAPYIAPGVLLTTREYDDGVMFAAALTLRHGQMPYSDFVYLHPPGSFLWLVPAAALADVSTEPLALAVGRFLAIAIGVANTVMIALLLRKSGLLSIGIGAGLYAIWPVVLSTERTVMLEPVINLGLLVALLLVSTRKVSLVWLAGAVLGLALTVKYWAVVDVALVAGMVGALMGRRALARYAIGAVAAAGVVMLPFFAVDPAAMWRQTVVTQLSRPSLAVPFSARASELSLTRNIHAIDQRVPGLVWMLLVVALLALAAVPAVRATASRRPLPEWGDAPWWGLIALAHAAALAMSPVFFYHYATWLAAPLALSTGAAARHIRAIPWRRAAGVAMVVIILVLAVGESRRITPFDGASDRLIAWSAQRECVWGLPSRLVEANAVRRNLDNDCGFDVDPLGVSMVIARETGEKSTGLTDSPLWQERAMDQLARSDAALLGGIGTPDWMTASQRAEFERRFRPDDSVAAPDVWVRAGQGR